MDGAGPRTIPNSLDFDALRSRLKAAPDAAAQVRAATDIVAAHGDKPEPYVWLAEAHWRLGDLGEALAVVDRGLARFPRDLRLLDRGQRLAKAQDDTDLAIAYCLRTAMIPSQRRDAMLQISQLRLSIADAAGARDALEEAVECGAAREELRMAFAKVALLQRDGATGLKLLAEEEVANGPSPAIDTLRKKLRKRATAAYSAPAVRLKSAATAELRALAATSGVPTEAIDSAAPRFITPAGDILIQRAPESKALVLVFGGLASMFGDAAEDLGYFTQGQRVNAVFLSDPKRLFFLAGFASVGDYPASVAWVRALSDAWSLENIYCLGFSGGGYPALRYGLDIPARRVLTFAAPTDFAPGITKIERRGTALLNRVLTRMPHMCLNLRGEIDRLGLGAPEIINYYGAEMSEDAYHARNIEGLPTVSLRPLADCDSHAIMGRLKQEARYAEIMRDFLRDSDA